MVDSCTYCRRIVLLLDQMNRYAVIDFETTGFSPQNGDRVIEIGVVMIENYRIIDRYESLINPGVPIPGRIKELTGITTAIVRNAPPPQRIFHEVYQFIKDATFVAHNAAFERQFWLHELSRLGINYQHQFLCTMLISRKLYPWLPDHKLITLIEAHNIPRQSAAHRALPDALMTAELFFRMHKHITKLYPEKTITTGFLERYLKMKKADARSYSKSLVPVSASLRRHPVKPNKNTIADSQTTTIKRVTIQDTAMQEPLGEKETPKSEMITTPNSQGKWWAALLAVATLVYFVMG